MSRNVRWEELFPDELDAALASCPVVYLPFGLCEPHGLHNATGLDALKAHALACRAATEHGGIVAPPFFWHVHELGYHAAWAAAWIGERNPWLTSLPPWVLYHLFFYQLRAVAARGFRAALVITGHYGGNEHDFKRVAEVFMRHSPLRVWAGADYECIEYQEYHGDHAGRCETSQLWSLRPELVDMSRLADGASIENGTAMATGPDAFRASRREGDAIIASQVGWLGRKADELLAQYRSPAHAGYAAPGNPLGALTFDQAERIWQEELVPALPEFVSMNLQPGQEALDPTSSWASNERARAPQ